MRPAVAATALVALGAVAGTATYLAVGDDPEPPPTTTTTTAARTPTPAEVADAVIDSLEHGLEVPISREEAICIGTGLLEVVGAGDAAGWVGTTAPTLTAAERDALVRAVVTCIPGPRARALLGPDTTTTPPQDLPDEE